MKAYGDDLAYIHDVGHGDFARHAAPALLRLLRGHGITTGLVVDLGCGSGIWAEALLRAGYDVLGVDISPAMIARARVRAPRAEFRRASFLTTRVPECVAVTAISECFNYLFDRANTRANLNRTFTRIYRALRPGGLLVFDVLEPRHLRGEGAQRRFREGKDWAVLVDIEPDPKRARLTRRITSFRRVGKRYRRDVERHVIRLVGGAELARNLRRIGFRVTPVRGYGRLRFTASHIGLVAQKPANGIS